MKRIGIAFAMIAVLAIWRAASAQPTGAGQQQPGPNTQQPTTDGGAPPPATAGSAAPAADPNAAPVHSTPVEADERRRWFRPFIVMEVDVHARFGRSVSAYRRVDGSGLYPGFTIQLARLGARGTIYNRVRYQLWGEFGIANSVGPFQTSLSNAGINDAWISYEFHPAFQLTLGQQTNPFGLEQMRIGDFRDFTRASRTSLLTNYGLRDIGLMANGRVDALSYAVGIFNGEGRSITAVDRQAMGIARIGVRVNQRGSNRLQVAASGSYGGNDPKTSLNQGVPGGFQTTRGYAFWENNYLFNPPGTPPNTLAPVRVFRAGTERQVGADFMLQLGDLEIAAEGAYVQLGRREGIATVLDADLTLRSGEMAGWLYYANINYWFTRGRLFRDQRFLWKFESTYGDGVSPADRDDLSPAIAMRARWEQTLLTYDSIARSPEGTPRGLIDQYTRNITANTFQVGAVAWFGWRVWIQAEYGLNWFPANFVTSPAAQGRRLDNQALAPGAVVVGERGTVPPSTTPDVVFGDPAFYRPYDLGARTLHEVTLRVGLNMN